MATEALVQAIKQIMTVAKSGDADGANAQWADLFASPAFAGYRPEDQRQALKLLILAKRSGPPAASLLEVFGAAIPPLTALTAAHAEPSDFELLGLCHLHRGNTDEAAKIFRAGLDGERARSAESDLCGRLMKHLSAT